MALREFRDANGVEWRVWATIPEASALVRVQYGPLGGLAEGWLTFECAGERKRLVPVPAGWDSCSDAELEQWCREAKAPPRRRSERFADSAASSPSLSYEPLEVSTLDPSTPARTFTGASGRSWRVTEHERTLRTERDDRGVERVVTHFVLRFSSEHETLELRTYPMAWARLTDAELLRLARQASRVTGGDTRAG